MMVIASPDGAIVELSPMLGPFSSLSTNNCYHTPPPVGGCQLVNQGETGGLWDSLKRRWRKGFSGVLWVCDGTGMGCRRIRRKSSGGQSDLSRGKRGRIVCGRCEGC
ncbi:hypothetical protein Hanom_Chr04g00297211 [Helianthus anomalus]